MLFKRNIKINDTLATSLNIYKYRFLTGVFYSVLMLAY